MSPVELDSGALGEPQSSLAWGDAPPAGGSRNC